MRHYAEQDGGGQQVQGQDGLAGLGVEQGEVEEGAAGPVEQDGGGGQQVQGQDGQAGLGVEQGEVEEGAAGQVEVMAAAAANHDSDNDGGGVDMMEIATVVPGIKDHKSDLVKAGARLKKFMIDHGGVRDFNIDKSVEDLQVALSMLQHPFSRIIVDYNRNFFEDVLEFAIVNTPELLYVIMRLTSTNQALYSYKDVIQAASLYTQVATSINPSVYCALNQWLATTLQACGLTGPGLEILSTLGLTVGSRFLVTNLCRILSIVYSVSQCSAVQCSTVYDV